MLKNRNSAMRVNNREGRKWHTAGFTMAEMLIVVAIIGVLAAVSFIAVQAHQKSMTQLQYDAIAKEIFVAAQNHLTLAKSENYQQKSDLANVMTSGFFGTKGNADADTNDDIYYFASTSNNAGTALDQILPFGAVELVTGGEYIIRYQPNTARVLDVFYWTNGSDRYDANLDGESYTTLVGSAASASDRHQNYRGNALLGWCGGEGIVKSGEYLEAPEIEVINKEMLLVTVTNPNTDKLDLSPQLKLIVSGNQSHAMVAIPLSMSGTGRIVPIQNGKSYAVVLDSITEEGLHFADVKNEGYEFKKNEGLNIEFIPGENITIQAVSYSNDFLTSVAYSGEWTTNSLFDEVSEDPEGNKTTKISNMRHLENLNDGISSLAFDGTYFNNTISAVQTVDLDWSTFKTNFYELKKDYIDSGTDNSKPISIYDKNKNYTKDNCFLPVSVNYTLNYNGQSNVEISETTGTGENTITTKKTFTENHSIKGIVVDNTGVAPGTATFTRGGVFGSLTGGEIENLALIDTNVTLASGDAGALAGTLNGTKVENVIAYNSTDATTANITTASGSAGGLVGSVSGDVKMSKSAAALIVNSTAGNAGGLIGTAAGGTITGCYSGGHTIEKKNGTGTDAEVIGVIYDSESYNVTAGAYAGGLIGDAGAAKIENSYSTCSAKGKDVGGFVGKASGTITNSYCTGLVGVTGGSDGQPVSGTAAGAFAAECTGTTTDCSYFEIVNEFDDENLGFDYLTALPKVGTGDGSKDGVTALDADVTAYNDNTKSWSNAEPYLKASLMNYYGEGIGDARVPKYNLKGVGQLGVTLQAEVKDDDGNVTTPADFVATHYGDWPAPEIFVINTAS